MHMGIHNLAHAHDRGYLPHSALSFRVTDSVSVHILYCWCHSDSASVLLYFTFLFSPPLSTERIIFINSSSIYMCYCVSVYRTCCTTITSIAYTVLLLYNSYCYLIKKNDAGVISLTREIYPLKNVAIPRCSSNGRCRGRIDCRPCVLLYLKRVIWHLIMQHIYGKTVKQEDHDFVI